MSAPAAGRARSKRSAGCTLLNIRRGAEFDIAQIHRAISAIRLAQGAALITIVLPKAFDVACPVLHRRAHTSWLFGTPIPAVGSGHRLPRSTTDGNANGTRNQPLSAGRNRRQNSGSPLQLICSVPPDSYDATNVLQ